MNILIISFLKMMMMVKVIFFLIIVNENIQEIKNLKNGKL